MHVNTSDPSAFKRGNVPILKPANDVSTLHHKGVPTSALIQRAQNTARHREIVDADPLVQGCIHDASRHRKAIGPSAAGDQHRSDVAAVGEAAGAVDIQLAASKADAPVVADAGERAEGASDLQRGGAATDRRQAAAGVQGQL
ncbi:hypothetical protein [Vulcanococcus sp.]|uniref:hypothetical protein n=1 Tax=Vulcanococcus sp. TaxID=2856995 RepID=UPI0037DA70ED